MTIAYLSFIWYLKAVVPTMTVYQTHQLPGLIPDLLAQNLSLIVGFGKCSLTVFKGLSYPLSLCPTLVFTDWAGQPGFPSTGSQAEKCFDSCATCANLTPSPFHLSILTIPMSPKEYVTEYIIYHESHLCHYCIYNLT